MLMFDIIVHVPIVLSMYCYRQLLSSSSSSVIIMIIIVVFADDIVVVVTNNSSLAEVNNFKRRGTC